jgi:hypothetical protein
MVSSRNVAAEAIAEDLSAVMPALVAGIHVFDLDKDVDGRDKPGHDAKTYPLYGWRAVYGANFSSPVMRAIVRSSSFWSSLKLRISGLAALLRRSRSALLSSKVAGGFALTPFC